LGVLNTVFHAKNRYAVSRNSPKRVLFGYGFFHFWTRSKHNVSCVDRQLGNPGYTQLPFSPKGIHVREVHMRCLGIIPAASVAALLFSFAAARADNPLETRGKIDSVTVYRGEALVTRLVDVPGPAGLKELVVTDLPEQVLPGSIYAESAEGVEVRSVSYRARPVEKDVREAVRKLDDQLLAIQDKLTANQRHSQLLAEQREFLTKVEQFTAPTAITELSKGVLNAETLEKLTQFQFTERARLTDDELKLGLEQRTLNAESQTLTNERSQLATTSSKQAREALVFVNLKGPAGQMRVRYLVGSASWAPSYNIRSAAGHDTVTLEYLGSVQQMSGEDWTAVAMTLSTATPSLAAKAPPLKELDIALAVPRGGGGGGGAGDLQRLVGGDYKAAQQEFRQQQAAIENSRNVNPNAPASGNPPAQQMQQAGQSQQAAVTANDGVDADVTLNEAAGNLQLLDLLNKENISRGTTGKPSAGSTQEGLAVTYTLPNRTSLPSRSDEQLLQISSLPLKAEMYKIATPVLTSFVYNEAQVSNNSQTVLLAGPVSTYVDGEFVGQGLVPSVAVGEDFTVGLGIDSSLRATRDLVEKTETTQGGNRVIQFNYRVALENFSTKPAAIRVLDRLPIAKENEIKVTLLQPGRDLSKDPAYERQDKKKGILRWDLDVPAQALAAKAAAFEYQFQLEYDKQLFVTGMPARK